MSVERSRSARRAIPTNDGLARFPLTWTVHWSDETGRSWSSQLNEIRNLAEPSHILSWERSATWGRAVFR